MNRSEAIVKLQAHLEKILEDPKYLDEEQDLIEQVIVEHYGITYPADPDADEVADVAFIIMEDKVRGTLMPVALQNIANEWRKAWDDQLKEVNDGYQRFNQA